MKIMDIFQDLSQYTVIPVIAIEQEDAALPLADALIEGGLPVAEITFRTDAAANVISTLSRDRPELLLGAGTILSIDNLKSAIEAGAGFGVSPGLSPAIVKKAQDSGFPFIPGVATPSDIENALGLGATLLKFFPAEASGGVNMLKALSAPYAHTGVRFMPTGGVTLENMESYLANPAVAILGGTWIAGKALIAAKKWDTIRENCRRAVKIVEKIRKQNQRK